MPRYLAVDYLRSHEQNQRKKSLSLQRNGLEICNQEFFSTLGKQTASHNKAFELALHDLDPELLDKAITDDLLNNTMQEGYEIHEISSDSSSPDVGEDVYDDFQFQYFIQQMQTAKKRTKKNVINQKTKCLQSSKIHLLKNEHFPEPEEHELSMATTEINDILIDTANDLVDVDKALDDANNKCMQTLDKGLRVELHEVVQSVKECSITPDEVEVSSNKDIFCNMSASSEEFDFVIIDAVEDSDSNEDNKTECSEGKIPTDECPSMPKADPKDANAIANQNSILNMAAVDISKVLDHDLVSVSKEKCRQNRKELAISTLNDLVEQDTGNSKNQVNNKSDDDDVSDVHVVGELIDATNDGDKMQDSEVVMNVACSNQNRSDIDNHSIPVEIKVTCDDETNGEPSQDAGKLNMDQQPNPRIIDIVCLPSDDDDDDDHLQDDIPTFIKVASEEIPISLAQEMMDQYIDDNDDDPNETNSKSETNSIEAKVCEPFVEDAKASICEIKELSLNNKLETDKVEIALDDKTIDAVRLYCTQGAEALESSRTICTEKMKKHVKFDCPLDNSDNCIIGEEVSGETVTQQSNNIRVDVASTIIAIAGDNDLENTLKLDDNINVDSEYCSENVLRSEPAQPDDKGQNPVSLESESVLISESLELNRESTNSESQSLKPSFSSPTPPSLSSSSSIITIDIQDKGERACKKSNQSSEQFGREIENTNITCDALAESPIVDAMDLSIPKLIKSGSGETIEKNDSIASCTEQHLKNLSDLETIIPPKATDVSDINSDLTRRHNFHFVEKALKSPLIKMYDTSSSNVNNLNDVTCAVSTDTPSYPLAPVVLLTKSGTETSDSSLNSVPASNNEAVEVTEPSLVRSGQNNKLPSQAKIEKISSNNNTSVIRRFVKFKDDFDPVERFFSLRQKSSNRASSSTLTTSLLPQLLTNAPRSMPAESSTNLPIQAASTMQTSAKAIVDLNNSSKNPGITPDPSTNKECNITLSSSSGNVAVVTPSFNLQGPNVTKQTSFSPSQLVEIPKRRGPFTITCDILKVPITEEYAKLVTALGYESESSMSLLKSHKVLKDDQTVGDLTPEATRFIAKQFDNYARNNSKDITQLLKASAVLHLIVSALQSLINCCLPSAANQLKVMTDRNRAIIGDSLDDAVSCLGEISGKYVEAGVLHPKVLKLLEVLKSNFEAYGHEKDGIKKAVIVVEADYATSLGAYLCECIGSTMKGIEMAFFVPLVQANELHKVAEELKERLSSHTILISIPAIIPVVEMLMKESAMHLILIEYSHSNKFSFGVGPNEVLGSEVECLALECQRGLPRGEVMGKSFNLEDTCLSLKDVLVEQNSYTLITSQEFIKLPDVLCSLEAKHKITLVERSYPKTDFNEHYCDVLVDHESGLLIDDISALTNDTAVDSMLIRLTRLSSKLSRCWVVFYNFNCSQLTAKLVSNYYSLVSIGAVVSSKCTGYEIKFLCCKSVECVPRLVRRVADHIFKKSLGTFEEDSKEKWLGTSFVTPDPTKHETILVAFPCFNSMSAQMLLKLNSLKLLMSSSLAELQSAYPAISSRFLEMFIKFRQSTSPMYRQLKDNTSYFNDGRLESDSIYFPKHSIDKAMDDRNNMTTDSIGDTTFFDLTDVDNISTNNENNMFAMKMKNARDFDDVFEGSNCFGAKTSGGFYQLDASSPAPSGSRRNDGGRLSSAGRISKHPTSVSTEDRIGPCQDHFDYHDNITMGKKDYFDQKQNYFKHREDKEGTGLAIFRQGISSQKESETYCKEDFSSALPFYADHQPPSRHDFDWLVHTMDEEDGRFCQRRDPWGQTGMEGFHGYESPSYSFYDDRMRCDGPSSSNNEWGIGHDIFRPYPSRVNQSACDGWRASNDVRDNIRRGHQKDYRVSERKRKLTYELDESLRNGQTKLKFI